MKTDFADVFAGAIGEVVLKLAAWLGVLWMAATITGLSVMAGESVDSGHWVGTGLPFKSLLWVWIFPGLISIAGITGAVLLQVVGVWSWSTVCAALSLAGVAFAMKGAVAGVAVIATVWGVWLVSVVGVATSLWFLRQWQMNRWARQLFELKAENAMRRLQLKEEHGIDSAGFDETNAP